jgi:hypothetical protein
MCSLYVTFFVLSQGVRCPLKNCDKLFRSEYLLMMHVKHYHSPYYHLVGNSPSVTDMAFHRTRLGESLDKVAILFGPETSYFFQLQREFFIYFHGTDTFLTVRLKKTQARKTVSQLHQIQIGKIFRVQG